MKIKMRHYLATSLTLLAIFHVSFAPPVSQNKDKDPKDNGEAGLEDYMEYHRYLREVVNALESDPDFRQKLEKAEEPDIRSGKIAEELEFVSHHVRTRLDEIKRVELNRLKELTEKQRQLQKDAEGADHRHLDHSNPHTFEIDDLKKLIAKTTEDLAEADRKRKEEFKQYEMQKELEKQVKLNHTNGDERDKLAKEFQELEEKHKKHEKLHEPGHKAQLEEVWQEQDQMQQEFDPKTFFMLHDMDSNGLWDQDEVKALFVKELEKMYAAGEPEDDMRERAEEMERMRESVFKEVDLNRDGFIDFEEFLAQTKRNDFQQDHGWQGLDEQKPYTNEELEAYIRQHQAANQIPHGYPQPGYPYPPQQLPPGYQAVPQQQFHPGQGPQYHPQQGHLPDLNTNEVYPQHPPQAYQQQYHQGPGSYQQPPQGYQHQQPPQGYQQQQPPQGYQQQQPPQGYQPQQPPQGYQQHQAPQGVPQQPVHQQPPQGVPQQQQPPQGGSQQGVPQQGNSQQQQRPQGIPNQAAPSNTAQSQGNNRSGNQGPPQVNKV